MISQITYTGNNFIKKNRAPVKQKRNNETLDVAFTGNKTILGVKLALLIASGVFIYSKRDELKSSTSGIMENPNVAMVTKKISELTPKKEVPAQKVKNDNGIELVKDNESNLIYLKCKNLTLAINASDTNDFEIIKQDKDLIEFKLNGQNITYKADRKGNVDRLIIGEKEYVLSVTKSNFTSLKIKPDKTYEINSQACLKIY